MANNEGKRFEEDIKKSVPNWCWIYRFKDGTANFSGAKNENVRFQAHNICDFMVMTIDKLFLLELKSHKGVSIPFNCIRPKQIEEMSGIDHQNIRAFFIFNFRDLEKTYAVKAELVKNYIENSSRKSIPIQFCINQGIEIPGEKKKVRFRYNLERLFNL
jgi:recombination protein U